MGEMAYPALITPGGSTSYYQKPQRGSLHCSKVATTHVLLTKPSVLCRARNHSVLHRLVANRSENSSYVSMRTGIDVTLYDIVEGFTRPIPQALELVRKVLGVPEDTKIKLHQQQSEWKYSLQQNYLLS